MRTPALWSEEFYQAINPVTIVVGLHQAAPGFLSEKKHIRQTDFDLWYVAGGDGAAQIDGCWHEFVAGDLLTICPGQIYQREKTSYGNPFRIYYAHILPFGAQQWELTKTLASVWPLRLALAHRPEIGLLFRQYHDAFHTGPHGGALQVKGLLLQILGLLLAEIRHPSAGAISPADRRMARVKELIDTEYAADLTLAQLAEQTALSRGHFCTAFTRYAGCPPIEYLLCVRIREAQKYLTTGMPIKEVAEAVGCHSQHYFSRLFRNRTGMSPIEFARRYGGKHSSVSRDQRHRIMPRTT